MLSFSTIAMNLMPGKESGEYEKYRVTPNVHVYPQSELIFEGAGDGDDDEETCALTLVNSASTPVSYKFKSNAEKLGLRLLAHPPSCTLAPGASQDVVVTLQDALRRPDALTGLKVIVESSSHGAIPTRERLPCGRSLLLPAQEEPSAFHEPSPYYLEQQQQPHFQQRPPVDPTSVSCSQREKWWPPGTSEAPQRFDIFPPSPPPPPPARKRTSSARVQVSNHLPPVVHPPPPISQPPPPIPHHPAIQCIDRPVVPVPVQAPAGGSGGSDGGGNGLNAKVVPYFVSMLIWVGLGITLGQGMFCKCE